jgi:hypothetical protein
MGRVSKGEEMRGEEVRIMTRCCLRGESETWARWEACVGQRCRKYRCNISSSLVVLILCLESSDTVFHGKRYNIAAFLSMPHTIDTNSSQPQ